MGPVQWLTFNVLNLFISVVIINAILSWLVAFDVVNTRNKLVGTIADVSDRITSPVLNPIRKVVPAMGGVDISPIILWLIIGFLQRFVVPLIPF